MTQRLGVFSSQPLTWARFPSRYYVSMALRAAAPFVRALPASVRNQLADVILKSPDISNVFDLAAGLPVAELISWVRLVQVDELPVLRRALVDLLLVPGALALDARGELSPFNSAHILGSESGAASLDPPLGRAGAPRLVGMRWPSVSRHGLTIVRPLLRVCLGRELEALPQRRLSEGLDLSLTSKPTSGVLVSEAAMSSVRLPNPIASLSSEASLGIWCPPETLRLEPRGIDRSNDFRTRFQWIGKVEDHMERICRPYLLRLDLARLAASDVVHSRAESNVLISDEEYSSSLVDTATSCAPLVRTLCEESAIPPLATDLVSSLSFASQGFTQFIDELTARTDSKMTSPTDSD